jgi:hypothetical protein
LPRSGRSLNNVSFKKRQQLHQVKSLVGDQQGFCRFSYRNYSLLRAASERVAKEITLIPGWSRLLISQR